jgi:hypothetical protein
MFAKCGNSSDYLSSLCNTVSNEAGSDAFSNPDATVTGRERCGSRKLYETSFDEEWIKEKAKKKTDERDTDARNTDERNADARNTDEKRNEWHGWHAMDVIGVIIK